MMIMIWKNQRIKKLLGKQN